MTIAVYIAIYVGLAIFLAGCIRRIDEYSRTPLHLRWELYPVPHEKPAQAEHGGSYFESQGWWREPQEIHHLAEWSVMFEEIILLKSLRAFNPRLWPASFLFHFGMYLEIAAAALLALAALPGVLFPGHSFVGFFSATAPAIGWMGLVGAVLIIAGACLLLMRRLCDPELKNYTKAADIFNLFFFVVTFALLAAGFLTGHAHSGPLNVMRGAFRFNRSVTLGPVLASGLILASTLIAYIPFTHMSHFIAKYFAWHAVRWDDRRNEPGSAIEARMAENLRRRPTWTAAHLGADGEKTWAEIATTNPQKGASK